MGKKYVYPELEREKNRYTQETLYFSFGKVKGNLGNGNCVSHQKPSGMVRAGIEAKSQQGCRGTEQPEDLHPAYAFEMHKRLRVCKSICLSKLITTFKSG